MGYYVENANGVLVPNYSNMNQALSRNTGSSIGSSVGNFFNGIGNNISNAYNSIMGNNTQPFNWDGWNIKNGAVVGKNDAFGTYVNSIYGMDQFNKMTPELQSSVFAGWQNNQQATAKNDPTGLDYASFGINTVLSGLNALMSYRGLKAQEKALNENIALNRANFKQQAETLNTQYRDQLSGRGRVNQGVGALNRARSSYASRKLDTTY